MREYIRRYLQQWLTPKADNRFGWKPDLPDIRDHIFTPTFFTQSLPERVDLRPDDVPIWNQLNIGSCTANATGSMYHFVAKKQGYKYFEGSRLFLYYNARALSDSVNVDAGAYIRDALKSINTNGICEEGYHPYNPNNFSAKPSEMAYLNAQFHQAIEYSRIKRSLNEMKACLADGYPFVFGFSVYDSFMSEEVGRTGIVPVPATTERLWNGHAVKAIGYDDTLHGGVFICKNSWGENWGDSGYFYLPYVFLTTSGLSGDMWTIRTTEG